MREYPRPTDVRAIPLARTKPPQRAGGKSRRPSPWPPGLPSWGADVIGTPVHDFEPAPANAASYRPDTLADGWATDRFTIRLASVRGYAHRYRGVPRQDDAAVISHERTGAVVFAISDGVSSAQFSHIGATAACRAAINTIVGDLDKPGGEVDWNNVVEQSAWQLTEQARVVLGLDEPDPGRAEKALACTLVAGVVRPTSDGDLASLIQVGDSAAWLLCGDAYRPLLGGKNRNGDGICTSEVIGLPRTPRVTSREELLMPGEVLLVGTDGFGDPLGDGTGAVGRYFADRLAVPQPPLDFARYLDFSRDTFDDDRTLLALWPRPGALR